MADLNDLYTRIGELVRARREDAGLTQDELGERLEMTRTSVTNIENARQRVQIDKLYEIAEVLGVAVSALLPPEIEGEMARIPSDHLSDFPAEVREWVRAMLVIKGQGSADELYHLEWIRQEVKISADKFNPAAWLLSEDEFWELPIPLEKIARNIGVDVRYGPVRGHVAAAFYRDKTHAIIAVNSLQPTTRQRFAVAHALGHLALHDYGFHVDTDFPTVPAEEAAASNFGAELLVPQRLLEKDLAGKTLDFENGEVVRELAERYRVSEQVICVRLSSLYEGS